MKKIIGGGNLMKKFFKFLKVLVFLSGLGAIGYFLFKDKIKDKFFNSKYEDAYLKAVDVGRLVWDLVNWPIDYVKAILP